MDAYVLTAVLIVAATTIVAITVAVTNELLRERRLRRMVATGRLVTYGITGDPDDYDRQVADLADKYRLARSIGEPHDVTPFPARAARTGHTR